MTKSTVVEGNTPKHQGYINLLLIIFEEYFS